MARQRAPRLNQSVEQQVIDGQTGEILKQSKNQVLSWGAEPSFIKLYLDDIVYLSDLPPSNAAVLHELLGRATYAGSENGMQIIVNKYVKEQVMEKLKYKNIGTVENAITQLVKGKIFYRIDRGVYNLNPYFFGKGDWQDIAKLRLEVNYSEIEGKTFKAVCEYKSDKEVLKMVANSVANSKEHTLTEEDQKTVELLEKMRIEQLQQIEGQQKII